MIVPLRIKKAMVALADGRLEEAYQQAIHESVRDHRKGQRLIGRLTKAYEKRARVHLNAGNRYAAMTDADRAARLGGNQPGIVALRDDVRREIKADERMQHVRHQQIAAARRCLASGDYSLGVKICGDVVDSSKTVANLMQDAKLQRQIAESALVRGRKALKAGQWDRAVEAIEEAKRVQPTHTELVDFLAEVTRGAIKHIRQLIATGRLDQVEPLLSRIRCHAETNVEVQELSRFMSQCRDAGRLTRSTEANDAVAQLKTLKPIVPEARWLDTVIKEAESVAQSLEHLRTGPLGLMIASANTMPEPTIAGRSPRSTPPIQVFEATEAIPKNFLIHLDGTGSVLVARGASVAIGTQSHTKRVDVPLRGQSGLAAITIERMDEDYFFSADNHVPVNGKPTLNTLLSSKDLVRLGRRGTMQFGMPNSASTSATLDFTGIRLDAGNARRVILMDDAIVIGPQPSAHIQSLAMERAMVLHWRNGELRIRPMSRAAETEGAVLALDRPHDVDGLSLVVTRAPGVV